MTPPKAIRALHAPSGGPERGEPRRSRGRILQAMRLLAPALVCLFPLVWGCATAQGGPAAAPLTSADSFPSGAPKEPLVWADLTPATLARAKAERRFIVLDGSAEWCHFCHVMEAEPYHDPQVAEILAKSFIAVKVDVDARPDIEERYGA